MLARQIFLRAGPCAAASFVIEVLTAVRYREGDDVIEKAKSSPQQSRRCSHSRAPKKTMRHRKYTRVTAQLACQ